MKKDKVVFKKATTEYVKNFYGKDCAKSFKGYVALLGDKVVGIGGINFDGENMVLFSEMKKEMRPFKRDIVRGIHLLMQLVNKQKIPIIAVASNKEMTSENLLTKLGFIPTGQVTESGPVFWRVK